MQTIWGFNLLSQEVYCCNRSVSIAERDKALESVLMVGANSNQGNKDLGSMEAGRYPLTVANEACDKNMIDILLKYGTNPNFKTIGENYFPVLNICGSNRLIAILEHRLICIFRPLNPCH
jgi:hypothetical protein